MTAFFLRNVVPAAMELEVWGVGVAHPPRPESWAASVSMGCIHGMEVSVGTGPAGARSRLPVPHRLRPAARYAVATYRHRGLRPADLVIASYPKSGSTWLRFLLSRALSGRDIDFDVVKDISPPLGEHRNGPHVVPGGGRLVKSHEAPRFVGPRNRRPRSLFLVRDGRDIATSYFHHARRRGVAGDDFNAFFDRYVNGHVSSLGSWQAHTRAWLDYAQTSGSVLTVRYEDLLADSAATLASINERFRLGLDEVTIRSALEHSTPAGMRAKESSSRTLAAKTLNASTPFVREAKAGTWRDNLPPDLCAAFEAVAGRELVALGYPLTTGRSHLGH